MIIHAVKCSNLTPAINEMLATGITPTQRPLSAVICRSTDEVFLWNFNFEKE